jgi:hypothetical protein
MLLRTGSCLLVTLWVLLRAVGLIATVNSFLAHNACVVCTSNVPAVLFIATLDKRVVKVSLLNRSKLRTHGTVRLPVRLYWRRFY